MDAPYTRTAEVNVSVVVNCLSGSYSPNMLILIERALADSGYKPQIHVVATLAEAQEISASIMKNEPEPYIIVAGGDGTFNAVLNGIEPGKATLAIIPVGTANVLAHELGIFSIDDAMSLIREGKTAPLTAGAITIEGKRRYFCLMAGIGVDGAVVGGVGKREKQLFKKGAYGLSALRTLWRWDQQMMSVTIDAEKIQCHSVVISNAAGQWGNFLLDPYQDISIPFFTVSCITSHHRSVYARIAYNLLQGDKRRVRAFHQCMAREITITGNKPVQVDGDFIGYGPAEVKTVANFARIIRRSLPPQFIERNSTAWTKSTD